MRHSHTLGVGVLTGLTVSQSEHALAYTFGAGLIVGALAMLAAVTARRAWRLGERIAHRLEHGPKHMLEPDDVPAAVGLAYLTAAEAEQHRLEGLRQGEAAGVRAAARAEVKDSAKRAMMEAALEDHWRTMTSARVRAGGAT